MLGTQYRMAPDIAEFSSKEFYHGKLQNGLNTAHRTTQVKLEYLDSGQKVLFLDHEGKETRGAKSRFNREEAMIVVELVKELFQRNPGMTSRDIGIISPYIAQTKLLKSMLCQAFGWTATSQDAVEVRTVDGFQGRVSSYPSGHYTLLTTLSGKRRHHLLCCPVKRSASYRLVSPLETSERLRGKPSSCIV